MRLTPSTLVMFALGLGLVPLIAALAGDPPGVAKAPAPSGAEIDEEEQEYQLARNRQVMRENCLICHSEELINSQRLTPAQWKAEVEKMVKWGAPLTPDQEQPLTEYLARQYPADADAPTLKRMTYAEALARVLPEEPDVALAVGDPFPGAKLYAQNCANCHGTDGTGAELGPNLVEKPVLLRPRDFHAVVQQGLRRMPGFQAVLQAEQEVDLIAWLRRQRYDAARAK